MFRRFPVEASTLIGVFDPAIDQPITVETSLGYRRASPTFCCRVASSLPSALQQLREYAPEPNPETKKKVVVWFALNDDRLITDETTLLLQPGDTYAS